MNSNQRNDPDVQQAVQDVRRILEQRPRAEREAIITQALDPDAPADTVRVETVRVAEDDPQDTRNRVLSYVLPLVLLLLILLLYAAATNRQDILQLPGSAVPTPTLGPRLDSQTNTFTDASGRPANLANMPALNSLSGPAPAISGRFLDFYNANGGEQVFGRPISPELESNGRFFQWFQRTRLEEWPEHAGTPYAIQSGRVGAEFTKDITFPKQAFFVSRPGMRYFAETGHGVTDNFLQFWEQKGGLTMLGYPISDQVQEKLPNNRIHTVQYFERGRIEYHPENADEASKMQLGLLGQALYLNDSRPNIIPPPRPTAVPMP